MNRELLVRVGVGVRQKKKKKKKRGGNPAPSGPALRRGMTVSGKKKPRGSRKAKFTKKKNHPPLTLDTLPEQRGTGGGGGGGGQISKGGGREDEKGEGLFPGILSGTGGGRQTVTKQRLF